ncbi:hypothetical protein FPOA_12546 [Fusarium poae]|uniref:Restriction endonuclease domain-containing protein n=1 Tax=Fusarium poae TaxID=36050 RepID=A0A1B8A8W8_FUSPO|nr:hypothetical protein FPOA_12546 [Fusarium poae]
MEDTHQLSPESSPKASLSLSHPVKPHRKITPPERKLQGLPPSPPASDERKRAPIVDELPQDIVDLKRKYEIGGEVSPLTSFPLSKEDYTRLRPKLEATFRRFDYEPQHERIIFRMPSRIHDIFAQFIQDAIFNALSELGHNNENVRPFTTKIVKAATSDIFTFDNDDPVAKQRSPDAQFIHIGAQQPSVVVEVAASQDAKQLSKLAKGYIHDTWGDIKAVLCFALNKPDGSTISVWKPKYETEQGSDEPELTYEQVVQSQPFRTPDKNPINQDNKLVLDLHDFAPCQLCEGYSNLPISIPFTKLYDILDYAEEIEHSLATGVRSNRQVKRRRVSSSSLESITEEDKKKWKDKDRVVKQKLAAEDGEYKGGHDGEPSAKRAQKARSCTQPSIVESDSDETVSG